MLKVENVVAHYGESRIINEVSLEVPPGKVACLMGRNGVGKTTLLKTVMGVIKACEGRILFGDEDLTRQSTSRRARAGIGYVPQGRGIFPYLTVYENLLMGFEAAKDRRIDPQAVEEMYALFPVIKQMRSRVAGTLSGGQQQQLAFARALIRGPKLLMLDEPTEGIQPSIMQEIEGIIHSLKGRGDLSILLVEQFLDFALSVADTFYVMETGAIVAQGRIDEFQEDVVKEYLAV